MAAFDVIFHRKMLRNKTRIANEKIDFKHFPFLKEGLQKYLHKNNRGQKNLTLYGWLVSG